jgi:Tfp pilus assembly protein PilF
LGKIAEFSEAIRINPEAADAYYQRGFAYYATAQQVIAEKDFARAKELRSRTAGNTAPQSHP